MPSISHAKQLTPLPYLIPIRYDLQIQLPTASDQDPLIPTFLGALKLEFQLTRPIAANTHFNRLKSSQNAENLTQTPTSLKFSQFNGIEFKLKAENLNLFENVSLKIANTNRKLPIADIFVNNHTKVSI